MAQDKEVYTYISHQGVEYPARIISRYDYHVDIELADENLTMLHVIKYKIKEIAHEEGALHG